jgi:spore germination protein YaaH
LAPYLDQIMVMTYDEHYAGGSPGPVASYPWFEKVINYTLRSYPSSKIVMGIAAYGTIGPVAPEKRAIPMPFKS